MEVNEIDPVWVAVKRMLPSSLTDEFALGMTGVSARRSKTPLLHSDLLYWLFPGLAMCGIEATLTPLPDSAEACHALLQLQIQRGGGVCLFAFSGDLNLAPFAEDSFAHPSDHPEVPDMQERDPAITEMAFVTAFSSTAGKSGDAGTITFTDSVGDVTALDIAAVRSRFSHALVLQKAARRPVKAEAFAHAVRTWAQFGCACPTRMIGTGEADAPMRTLAAAFWRHMAGSGRSARSNRLRRVAELLQAPKDKRDIAFVFRSLYEMACNSLFLPPYLENTLLAPDTAVLSDAERRELIYLARAGTRAVKIFAAHRLTFERECADARATLLQLRYDPDAWVRGAAQI